MSVSFIDGHIDELKITDDGIIKALECYTKEKTLGECKKSGCSALTPQGCSYYLRTDDDFMGVIFGELIKDALDLINRQKAEIERLRAECGNQSNLWSRHYESIFETAKAEAVKEFAEDVQGEIDDAIHSNYNAKEERVTKSKKLGIPIDDEDSFLMYCEGKIHALSGVRSYIDNLLKETVGDANGKRKEEIP